MMTTSSSKFTCPINGNVTIKFETDAEDNYFDEHVGLGKDEFLPNIVQRSKLRTGIYTLTLKPSLGITNLEVGQKINFKFIIYENNNERWVFEIPIEITEPLQEPEEPEEPEGPTPRGPNRPFTRIETVDPSSKQNQSLIDRPEFMPISKEIDPETWEKIFEGNEKRGASVEIDNNNRLKRILVNISHPRLLLYQDRNPDVSVKHLVARYVNFIGFYTWSVYLNVQSGKFHYPENYDSKEIMEATADALAFFGLGYLDASNRI